MLSLRARKVNSAEDLPDEALFVVLPWPFPLVEEPLEVLLALLLPLALPLLADELLLLVALPLPEMLALLEPPFPPVAELFAEPELPDEALLWPLEPSEAAFASPLLPELALLFALPPLPAFWVMFCDPPWALLPFDAFAELSELQLPAFAVLPVFPWLPLPLFELLFEAV